MEKPVLVIGNKLSQELLTKIVLDVRKNKPIDKSVKGA